MRKLKDLIQCKINQLVTIDRSNSKTKNANRLGVEGRGIKKQKVNFSLQMHSAKESEEESNSNIKRKSLALKNKK